MQLGYTMKTVPSGGRLNTIFDFFIDEKCGRTNITCIGDPDERPLAIAGRNFRKILEVAYMIAAPQMEPKVSSLW